MVEVVLKSEYYCISLCVWFYKANPARLSVFDMRESFSVFKAREWKAKGIDVNSLFFSGSINFFRGNNNTHI